MIAPITREEARALASNREFPDFVIQAFNECIAEMVLDGDCEIKQDKAMDRVLALGPKDLTRQAVYANHWLDVEDRYKSAGWTMVHHKPAYYESWEPYWSMK